MNFDQRFPDANRPISWQASQSAGYAHGGGVDHMAVLVCHECWGLVSAGGAAMHSALHDAEPTPVVCNHRWKAPRNDAPNSVEVTHVCTLEEHPPDEPHRCSCDATRPVRDV